MIFLILAYDFVKSTYIFNMFAERKNGKVKMTTDYLSHCYQPPLVSENANKLTTTII